MNEKEDGYIKTTSENLRVTSIPPCAPWGACRRHLLVLRQKFSRYHFAFSPDGTLVGRVEKWEKWGQKLPANPHSFVAEIELINTPHKYSDTVIPYGMDERLSEIYDNASYHKS